MTIANISLGATTSASAAKAASISVTPSTAPTNTDTLIAIGGCHTSGTGSFSDNGSPANTYTVQVTTVNTVQADLGTVLSVGGSPTTVTYSNTAAKGHIAICLAEYSGVTEFGTTGSSSGSTSPATVTVTTLHPNDWLVGGGTNNSTGTLTAGASTNNRSTDTANQDTWEFDSGAVATPASTTLNETLGTPAAWATVAIILSPVKHLTVSQPVTTATSIIKTVSKPVSQGLTTLTTGIFTVPTPFKTLTVSQPVTSATALIKTISKPVSQPVTVFSSGTFLHIVFLKATQPITTSTALTKTVTKVVTQPVTSGTSLTKTVSKPVSQPITLGTAVAKTVSKPVSQPITVGTSVTKTVSKLVSQPVTVFSSGTFLHIVFLTVTQPIHVLPTYVSSVVTKVLAQGVHVLTTGITPPSGPKTLNVTQPVTVLTVFVSSGTNVGYFWGPAPPTSPAVGTVWMDTLAVVLKKWNGSGWVPVP